MLPMLHAKMSTSVVLTSCLMPSIQAPSLSASKVNSLSTFVMFNLPSLQTRYSCRPISCSASLHNVRALDARQGKSHGIRGQSQGCINMNVEL